jgi:hypothetical protein
VVRQIGHGSRVVATQLQITAYRELTGKG